MHPEFQLDWSSNPQSRDCEQNFSYPNSPAHWHIRYLLFSKNWHVLSFTTSHQGTWSQCIIETTKCFIMQVHNFINILQICFWIRHMTCFVWHGIDASVYFLQQTYTYMDLLDTLVICKYLLLVSLTILPIFLTLWSFHWLSWHRYIMGNTDI